MNIDNNIKIIYKYIKLSNCKITSKIFINLKNIWIWKIKQKYKIRYKIYVTILYKKGLAQYFLI